LINPFLGAIAGEKLYKWVLIGDDILDIFEDDEELI